MFEINHQMRRLLFSHTSTKQPQDILSGHTDIRDVVQRVGHPSAFRLTMKMVEVVMRNL